MKNLLVYINPEKRFNQERDLLSRVQIDNSLRLGWKPDDILLVTNFDYSYNGVSAHVVDGSSFCPFRPLSTKTTTVAYLLKNNMIDDDIYWAHDFDAYQMNEFDIGLGRKSVGLTDYGWSNKWCLGSFFFNKDATDVFEMIWEVIKEHKTEDERALHHLTKNDSGYLKNRIKKLNITYNFGMRDVEENYKKADKPLKVLHFHPHYKDNELPASTLDIFMYGKNKLGIPLMDEGLIKLFREHGIK